MHAVRLFVAIGWAAFWGYWLLAAQSVKRGRIAWGRELRARVVLVAIVFALAQTGVFRGGVANTNPVRAVVGVPVFVTALAFSVWARLHLGHNWGGPMTQKEEPELVTTGPYRFVRHPIYSGLILAGIGTAVALDWTWLIAAALAAAYFNYSAGVEERFFTEQFPEAYPQYQRTTKRLVPFVY